MYRLRSFTGSLLLVIFIAITSQARPQTPSKVPLTTTVTVLGPKFTAPPPLTRQDILVYSGKNRLDTINWVQAPSQKPGLQLAILIDNSASQLTVGSQLKEIAGFISLQAKSTAVGVFYAENGSVQTMSDFTTNHDAAAKTLRLPFGPAAGESPSIYLSLSDLIKHRWPQTGARREVLLISNGVDRLDRGPQSAYVAAAIEDAQKAAVVIHAIYTGASLRFGETLGGQYAQTNLVQLTQETGGFNFFEGITPPVSFAPYLKELDMVLHNQYLLTFAIEPAKKDKGQLRTIEIRTEQRNVQFRYPKQVLVPAAQR